jgi:hypothetical protein
VSRRFEIRIRGRLSERVRAAFPGLEVVEFPAETVLSGRSRDEDEVQGVLGRIQSLGLQLVALRQAPRDPDDAETDPEPDAGR